MISWKKGASSVEITGMLASFWSTPLARPPRTPKCTMQLRLSSTITHSYRVSRSLPTVQNANARQALPLSRTEQTENVLCKITPPLCKGCHREQRLRILNLSAMPGLVGPQKVYFRNDQACHLELNHHFLLQGPIWLPRCIPPAIRYHNTIIALLDTYRKLRLVTCAGLYREKG